LNYAIPIESLRASVEAIRAGKFVAEREQEKKDKVARPLTLTKLGIALVPDVLERTPPYVDHVLAGSPADKAGIRPDDLVLLVGDRLVQSCKALVSELEAIDEDDEIRLTILRGSDLSELTLRRETSESPALKGVQP
jgi:serine protease Do